MSNTPTTSFLSLLRAARARWQAGLLLVAACDAAAAGVASFLLLTLADLAFVPESAGRQGMLYAGIGVTGLAALIGVVRLFLFRDRDLAHAVDRRQDARRRPVFGAWELLRQHVQAETETPLRAFLVETAAERGAGVLQALPLAGRLPWPRIGRSLLALALALSFAAAAVLVNTPALNTALARVLHPEADIPPYSSLVFRVTPGAPVVMYGGSTNLLVEITGGAVQGNVWLVTRDGGRVNRSVCFQESGARFGQRLEQVVQPVEFCFATRRARSPWHRVDLRTQPQISSSLLTIDPPAYSGLPREQVVAGREPLKALRGSRITLFLTSNRPLLDGRLRIRALDGSGVREVAGRLDSRQVVAIEWPLEGPAELEAVVRDVQGTACRQPLRFAQQVRPDQPPVVTLTDPPLFAVATPSSHLPVAGMVEDDLGLRRAELLRTVVGFRDRTASLAVPPGGRRMEFTSDLDLTALGVTPGQTLEFYIEAVDSNPTLAGLGASEVATVRIIADEEYANMLRTRVAMEQFSVRFQLLAQQLEEYRRAVKALEEAARSGAPNDKQQAALDRAREEARRTTELAHKIADDFSVFEQEKDLAASIRKSLTDLDSGAQELQHAQVGVTQLAKTAAHILDRLGEPMRAVAAQQQQAAGLEAAARVMWLSVDFRALLERQRLLVRRLEMLEQSTRPSDRELVPAMAQRQEEIERQLHEFTGLLRERAGALPDDFAQLRKDSLAFAKAVETCGADTNMQAAATAARSQRVREARVQAQEARDKLDALIKRACNSRGKDKGDGGQKPGEDGGDEGECGNSFGQMCQGGRKFDIPGPPNLAATLAQMLAGMCANGNGTGRGGTGTGSGAGGGGSSDDGYWMPGGTPLSIPAYGPPRMEFSMPSASGLSVAGRGQPGGRGAGVMQVGTRERLGTAESIRTRTGGLSPELLPEKYRDAVRRYFGGNRP